MSARVGVLALQGGVREHLTALASAGADGVPVADEAGLDGLAGLVLPGGESTTMGRLLARFALLEPLRAALADGLPVLGTCAGLVLLAREVTDGLPEQPLLGTLDIAVRRNAYGSQVASFEAELDLAGAPFPGVFIRAPRIERVGDGVEVLARGPAGEPVAVRQGGVLATSFHPELSGDERLHAYFLREVAGLPAVPA